MKDLYEEWYSLGSPPENEKYILKKNETIVSPRGECFECGPVYTDIHWHHVIPRVKGGTRTVPLCEKCHSFVHERNLAISYLIRHGIERAKKRGVRLGRPKLGEDKRSTVLRYRTAGYSIRRIAHVLEISKCSVQRIIKENNK